MSSPSDSKTPPGAQAPVKITTADPADSLQSHTTTSIANVTDTLNSTFLSEAANPPNISKDTAKAAILKVDQLPHPHTNDEVTSNSETLSTNKVTLSTTPEMNNLSKMESTEAGSNLPPPPPPKDEKYLASSPNPDIDPEKEALKNEDMEMEAEAKAVEGVGQETGNDSQSEIQSIMEQFDPGMGGPGAEEIMSPRLEIAGPLLGSPKHSHPPRKSSLEPLRSMSNTSLSKEAASVANPSDQPASSHISSLSPTPGLGITEEPFQIESKAADPPITPSSSRTLAALPPQPDPEPDLPFDFHRFLEQLRHRSADPVAKFLRSFLIEFGKKQWMVHEQVKIISDFLEFITKKMAQCEVWRTVSDGEFDNACEGMEKLVMNRLYSQTFSPAIPPQDPALARRRKTGQPPPGRRGQHQEDVERDEILGQKVRIYSWVREEHLDIKPLNDKGKRFLSLAQQELLKIGNYRAPRDKVICVLNSCKVIFGFLRNAQHDQSADSFIPLLIYTVLRANPPHLVSNVQYILRFRNANKLTGEAGYYVSSLGGAIDFIERLDRTSLTISDADFEKNVEASVSKIAEPHSPNDPPPSLAPASSSNGNKTSPRSSLAAPPLPTRPSNPRNPPISGSKSEPDNEENAAVAGLLRTIQKPLSTIGRIFSDDSSTAPAPPSRVQPPTTPQPAISSQQLSSSPREGSGTTASRPSDTTGADAAARQASQEAEEARKIRIKEESHVVETLSGMFPGLDRDVVVDVVRANEGRIGSAVDACLALSG